MRPKTLVGVALAVALLASFAGSATAEDVVRTPGTPTSEERGVVPYIQEPAGPGGNLDCDAVGEFDFESARIDDNFDDEILLRDGDANVVGTVAVTVTDGTFVAFTATIPIGAAIVKGGNAANVYEYNPQVLSDSGLASPENPSGGPAGLSNITFCANPEPPPPPDEGQWCSPGYWRQAHHLGSWEATGIAPNEAYNDYFDPDLAGDPTLWDVLQSPQTYGGAAFNNVGDLLSAAHPDVDFDGERVEDSCPLSGGGAGGRPETAGPASGGQGGPPPGKGPNR